MKKFWTILLEILALFNLIMASYLFIFAKDVESATYYLVFAVFFQVSNLGWKE